MTEGEPFVDHYAVLGVDWDCDARTLENAYRRLAKTYHPDHRETADVTKFNEVIAAYRYLRHRDGRAEYDIRYAAEMDWPTTASGAGDEGAIEERAALSDAEMHEKILRVLYRKRRENAQDAGVAPFTLQEELNCSETVFDFHVWYLKSKGFIAGTEQGTLAITIDGVEQVIAVSRTKKAEKLRLAQFDSAQE